MKDYLKFIEDKIKRNLNIQQIKITDNTDKHKKHKFFDEKKYHLHLEIESNYLYSLGSLEAQKIVMKILKEELQGKIHSLQIKIK